MNNMKEELTLEKKLQALQHHYNSFVDTTAFDFNEKGDSR